MSALPTAEPSSPARAVTQVTPRPVAWLWPARLALSKLNLLEGDPRLGKSFLTLDLCARLSTGRPWPDDTPNPAPAATLIINGEDGDEDTVVPRLLALGADPARCFFLAPKEPEAGPPLMLPSETATLDAALAQTGARLVVIDPVVAFLAPGVNLASDQSVRRALAPLARLAVKHACAMLLVLHLNKNGGRRALYRGLGSIGLVANCRTAWLVAADTRTDGRVVLAQVKNNLAPPQPALAFAIRAADGADPTVVWHGPTDWTADGLLAAAAAPAPRPGPGDCAREFLAEMLSAGPQTTHELWKHAEALGLNERTLRRACRPLEIRSVRVWMGDRATNYWLLPGQVLPADVAPDGTGTALDPWLDALSAEYPEPTPLDDL